MVVEGYGSKYYDFQWEKINKIMNAKYKTESLKAESLKAESLKIDQKEN